MILHLKFNHGVKTDATQLRLKSEALKVKCALPNDLRTAECMKCTQLMLCRNEFQLKKHSQLLHEMTENIRYGCRVCPDFHTFSASDWDKHFIASDYSTCNGINLREVK